VNSTAKGPPRFLIIDDVDENRFLLAKTLLRKFPGSVITECDDSATALTTARTDSPTAVVVHRARDLDGLSLVRAIRASDRDTPIIMVSGRESCPEAIEAGATAFLNYEAWLRIGTVVAEVLSPEYVKALTTSPFEPNRDFLGLRASDR
jgi:CheY-like chemotaxis protein